MLWLLVPLAALAACAAFVLLSPLVLQAQGRLCSTGDVEGRAAAAFGALTVSVQGPHPEAVLSVRLWNVRLLQRPLRDLGESAASNEKTTTSKERWKRPSAALKALDRHLGIQELLAFAGSQRRHVHLDRLSGHLRLGFEDMALTGQVYGQLWSLRGAFPQATRHFEHEADWSGQDYACAQGDVATRIYLGRILMDTAWFVTRRMTRRALPGHTKRLRPDTQAPAPVDSALKGATLR